MHNPTLWNTGQSFEDVALERRNKPLNLEMFCADRKIDDREPAMLRANIWEDPRSFQQSYPHHLWIGVESPEESPR
jgi:hypothetical protein